LAKTLKYLMSGLHFVVSSFSYIGPVSGATNSWSVAYQASAQISGAHRQASFRKWSWAQWDTASEEATR
jgi:hypothetical protein